MVSKWPRMFQGKCRKANAETPNCQRKPTCTNQICTFVSKAGPITLVARTCVRPAIEFVCVVGRKQDPCSIMKFKPDYSCRALLTFGGSSLSSCNAKMQTALTLLKDSMSRRLQVVGPGRIHKEQLFWLSLLSTSKSLRILARCQQNPFSDARCPKCLFIHAPQAIQNAKLHQKTGGN